MKFSWDKWYELPLDKRNTLQIFITNRCNLNCEGCFAKKVRQVSEDKLTVDMDAGEYVEIVNAAVDRGVQQINLLGGEPFLHPHLPVFIAYNNSKQLKTTIYTNGTWMERLPQKELGGAKVRVSFYGAATPEKSIDTLRAQKFDIPFDANFMVSRTTTLAELLIVADVVEKEYNCEIFFISSLRECEKVDFFDDTNLSMPLLQYKMLVHKFLDAYSGDMDIHVSKRGVFESTMSLPHSRCKFANAFIDGKIIQCPYDVARLKFQEDYEFDSRYCQQNNTCLMSKIILRRKIR